MTIFTIGHATRKLDDFIAVLHEAGVDHVVDVRREPYSGRAPQFNREALAQALGSAGIGYSHKEALGGLREERKDRPHSPHVLWRDESFRNFADYAETPAFHIAFADLLQLAQITTPVIMCAEAMWSRSHRRIIADYLLAAGLDVQHITEDKIEMAHMTDGAQPNADGSLIYNDTLFA